MYKTYSFVMANTGMQIHCIHNKSGLEFYRGDTVSHNGKLYTIVDRKIALENPEKICIYLVNY